MPQPFSSSSRVADAVSGRNSLPIPRFALYGETAMPGQDLLHIEEVQSRSRLYHWEIEPHVHQGLYQVLWLYQGSADVVLDEWRESVQVEHEVLLAPPEIIVGAFYRRSQKPLDVVRTTGGSPGRIHGYDAKGKPFETTPEGMRSWTLLRANDFPHSPDPRLP